MYNTFKGSAFSTIDNHQWNRHLHCLHVIQTISDKNIGAFQIVMYDPLTFEQNN